MSATPQYVALGSSFAAGIGLGPRDPGSPRISMRSVNGYPKQLARMLDLSLVDRRHLGADHHACAAHPWVNGWTKTEGTQFHPTLAGAKATAQAIAEILNAAS